MVGYINLPPRLERYELKYLIPYSLVESVSEFASVYCSLDKHSIDADDYFYRVNSLYFDTPNYTFLKNRMYGRDSRFNMRVRSYGNNPVAPFYLEIKQKKHNVIRKYRASLSAEEWPAIFEDPMYRVSGAEGGAERDNKALFYRLATSYAATPKVLLQYRRRAFFSLVDDYARVTMDIDMRCRLEENFNIIPDEPSMVPFDHELIYDRGEDRGRNVVLELKCYTTQVPLWMLDLIHCFGLERISFSKYMNSLLCGLSYSSSFNENLRQSAIL